MRARWSRDGASVDDERWSVDAWIAITVHGPPTPPPAAGSSPRLGGTHHPAPRRLWTPRKPPPTRGTLCAFCGSTPGTGIRPVDPRGGWPQKAQGTLGADYAGKGVHRRRGSCKASASEGKAPIRGRKASGAVRRRSRKPSGSSPPPSRHPPSSSAASMDATHGSAHAWNPFAPFVAQLRGLNIPHTGSAPRPEFPGKDSPATPDRRSKRGAGGPGRLPVDGGRDIGGRLTVVWPTTDNRRPTTGSQTGAGGRNRTDETCLEGRSFTTKLRPQERYRTLPQGSGAVKPSPARFAAGPHPTRLLTPPPQ